MLLPEGYFRSAKPVECHVKAKAVALQSQKLDLAPSVMYRFPKLFRFLPKSGLFRLFTGHMCLVVIRSNGMNHRFFIPVLPAPSVLSEATDSDLRNGVSPVPARRHQVPDAVNPGMNMHEPFFAACGHPAAASAAAFQK